MCSISVINHRVLIEKYLVEGLAVDILASDHYKLHTATVELLAMAVPHRQAADIPDIQAEVAHKEALCEFAGLHSLYSHPQTNLACEKRGEMPFSRHKNQTTQTSLPFSQKRKVLR